jgi:hypothetical protein
LQECDNTHKKSIKAASPARWGEISIVFVNDKAVEIHSNGIVQNKTFDELGFSDGRRAEAQKVQWELLRQFAEGRGELAPYTDIAKKVSSLRGCLKKAFPTLSDDPISFDKGRRAYVTTFQTSSRISREEEPKIRQDILDEFSPEK